jgi:hypothetical protein
MRHQEEEVQSERENKKIDAHSALACKQGLCNQNSKQTACRDDSDTNENNGNVVLVVQASRRSSITNNEATSTYQIP